MRLIDADALMPKLNFILEAEQQIYGKQSWGFASKCINAIEEAPTIDAVEVVRCKDCKHHRYEGDIPYCINADYGYGWNDDDFCSRGERRRE